jgi:spoIIIJ-associated protein
MGEQRQIEQQWLEQLLALMGFATPVKTQTPETGDESDWLVIDSTNLTPDQVQTLIGENGKTLDAIQYLANTQLNLGLPDSEQRPITIELEEYRRQRLVVLQALAEEMVQQVQQTGQEATTQPLSAAERKQVHHFLSTWDNVVTESQGTEPERHIVVRLRS